LCDKVEELTGQCSPLFELEVPLSIEKEANRIAKLIRLKDKERSSYTIKPTVKEEPDYQEVDVNSVKDLDVRFIGNESLIYNTILKLQLPDIFRSLNLNDKQINIMMCSIVGRIMSPSSERSAHKYITEISAIDELIGCDFSKLDLNQLYFSIDFLYKHKDKIETMIYNREKDIFSLEDGVILYDITNTYFEGHPSFDKAKKGRSKEKRSDCELVSLGLVLDSDGFPKKSTILPGNISEPSTLKNMLNSLEKKENTIIIMDAGISSKENIEYIAKCGYKYIVVTRNKVADIPEDQYVIVKNTANNIVKAALIPQKDNTVNLYCHSSSKEIKAKLFNDKESKKFEQELELLNINLQSYELEYNNLSTCNKVKTAVILSNGEVYINNFDGLIKSIIIIDTLTDNLENFVISNDLTQKIINNQNVLNNIKKYTGQVKLNKLLFKQLQDIFTDLLPKIKPNITRDLNKIMLRIGRLKERYKCISFAYNIEIQEQNTSVVGLSYTKNSDVLNKRISGQYCINSNIKDLNAVELWNKYTTLTEIESTFRSLKSELGLRPIYHQKDSRIEGHIFLTLLAYHIIHTIRYQLKQHNINYSCDSIKKIMQTQVRSSTIFDLKKGGNISIRKCSRETPEQKIIYNALNLNATPLGIKKTILK